jgi:hypothetical protein
MTNKSFDTVMGRVKEAVGALSGNRRLKDEGRVDQAKGSVKNAVDKVTILLIVIAVLLLSGFGFGRRRGRRGL